MAAEEVGFNSRVEMEKLVALMDSQFENVPEEEVPAPIKMILGGLKQTLANGVDDRVVQRATVDTNPQLRPEYPPNAQHWVTNATDEKEIYFSGMGIGVDEPKTVGRLFAEAVANRGDDIAYEREVEGEMVATSWTEYYEEAKQFAKACMATGLQDGDSINIIGFNSREWVLADVGIILASGIAAGQYATNNSVQIQYIAEHSHAKIMVAENKAQLDKMVDIQDGLTNLECFVTWATTDEELEDIRSKLEKPVLTFDEFMAQGDSVTAQDLEDRMALTNPRRCCTLIYTSGTTGNPKAVMMSHDNLLWTSKCAFKLCTGMSSDKEYRTVSYLPLSHVAAQVLDIHTPLVWASDTEGSNAKVTFARPDALKGTLFASMAKAKPTFFFGVPRVWEKLKAVLISKAASKGELMDKVIAWAKQCCKQRWDNNMISQGEDRIPLGYEVASKIMGKVKATLGLDECMQFFTGAAPISRETLEFFKYLDICVDEVYGMSETSGPLFMARLYHRETGSCGPILDGCEAMIDHVDGRDADGEGELCFRGRAIMMGYLTNEDKTREAIDENGFMHSGDVARIDENGCMYITGRIKELLITEGGENIAPVPAENYVKSNCPAISNFIMIGDKRKFCSALVTLKTTTDPATGLPTDILDGPATLVSEASSTVAEAKEDPVWQEYIQSGITMYNEDESVCISRASKIQYFRVLDQDLNRENETLGPTLKIKRPVVHEVYADVINSMYEAFN